MKAICVNVSKDWIWMKSFFGFDHPEVGDEVVVEERTLCSCGKHEQYQLASYPYSLFADHFFATLPGSTADEMAEITREAIIKQMNSRATIEDINQLVAIADLMIDKATKLKTKMLQARIKMAGVSTPAPRKGKKVDQKVIASVVAKRNARLGRSKKSFS